MSKPRDIPRYALTRTEAATSLGLSIDSFERYVQPDLRVVRVGRLVLIPSRELERWVSLNAARTLETVA